jgi:hypothetical protein
LEQEKEDGPGGGEDVLDNSAGLYIVFRPVVFGYPIQVTCLTYTTHTHTGVYDDFITVGTKTIEKIII